MKMYELLPDISFALALSHCPCLSSLKENGEVIGTAALMNEGHGIFELTKMTIDERFRGMKIGYKLGLAILEKAKQCNAPIIFVEDKFSVKGAGYIW